MPLQPEFACRRDERFGELVLLSGAEAHALGRAGGAGGEGDLGGAGGQRHGLGVAREPVADLAKAQRQRGLRRIGNERIHAGEGNDVRHLLRREERGQGHQRDARALRGEVGDEPVRSVVAEQAQHAWARAPERLRHARDRILNRACGDQFHRHVRSPSEIRPAITWGSCA